MDERTLDPDALDRLYRIGGNEFVVEMIELFLENAPQRLETARASLEGGDPATLHRAVHSMKSTAATLGADALQESARTVEALVKAGELDGIPALLEQLAREYGEAREQLVAERDRRSGV